MKDNLIARQLRRLGLAYEIQKVANPILKRGDTSQTSIYYNEILKKFAVCENTFRSLVKLKEAENFPIFFTKSPSLPLICSARATAASFALATATHLSNVSTVWVS